MKKENHIKQLQDLLNLLKEGQVYGLNIDEVERKLESAIIDLNNDLLNVVLFGSFSDGKTTVAAGWLEEEMSNMKIDVDESSDEICIYNSNQKNVRIIDTPGLFGDKEKKVENTVIKFEEETKKYISEAHLILYVVDAVNPVKDSHKNVIKWVLKDLGKLDQTIFVINKMDDVANLDDENDFNRNAEIKAKTLRDTLKQYLELKNNLEEKINIVCVSANPYDEGLKNWFNDIKEYRTLSHLESLKTTTNNVVQNNKDKLKKAVSKSVVKDVVLRKTSELAEIISTEKENQIKQNLKLKRLSSDLSFLKSDAGDAFSQVKQQIENIRENIFIELDSVSKADYYSFVERNLGVKKVDKDVEIGFVLKNKIQSIVDEAIEELKGKTKKIAFEIEETVAEINDGLQKMATKGFQELIKTSSKIPVNTIRDAILSTRNLLKMSTKFKPWGALKLASKVSKGIAAFGAVLEIGLKAWEMKKEADFKEEKRQLKQSLDKVFSDLLDDLGSKDDFINNYLPSVNILDKTVQDLEQNNIKFKEKLEDSEIWRKKLNDFFDAEDIPFEEVTE